VVGKNTIIPPNYKIGRNVIIGSDVTDDMYSGEPIKSGECFHLDEVEQQYDESEE
jgi:hypothetical protein